MHPIGCFTAYFQFCIGFFAACGLYKWRDRNHSGGRQCAGGVFTAADRGFCGSHAENIAAGRAAALHDTTDAPGSGAVCVWA